MPLDPESYRTPRLSYVFTGPDSADASHGDSASLDDTETEALKMQLLFGDDAHGSFTIAGPVSDLLRWLGRLGQPNSDGWPGWTSADKWDPKDDDLPPIGPDGVPTDCTPETCATTPSRHCCPNDYPDPAPVSPVDGEREVELLPAESISLTAGLAQTLRGDEVLPATAMMCVLALARITGRHDWTAEADTPSAADRGGEQ